MKPTRWGHIQTLSEFRERSLAFFSGVDPKEFPPILSSFDDNNDSIDKVFCDLLRTGFIPVHGGFQRFDQAWTVNPHTAASRVKFRHKALIHLILSRECVGNAHKLAATCKRLGYTVSSIVPCERDLFPIELFVRQVWKQGWNNIRNEDKRELYRDFRMAPHCVTQFPTPWTVYETTPTLLAGNYHFVIVDQHWPEGELRSSLFEDLEQILGSDQFKI